jgi:thiamine biosynthesis protein ThiS
MKLIVNGEERRVENVGNVADLARSLGYEGDFFAVALNRVCVARTKYDTTPVNENDDVEILSPMQGG